MNATLRVLASTAVIMTGVAIAPAAAQSSHLVVGAAVTISDGGAQYGRYDGPRYDRRSDGRWGSSGRSTVAFDRGYHDGFDKGVEDARDGDRFDVRRHRKYRDGESGYRRGDGISRDRYRDIYRRAFESGYDDGYRRASRDYRGDRRGPHRYDRHMGGFSFDWRF